MLRRYVEVIVARPKIVIALVLIVTIVLSFNIPKIKIMLDVDDQIPPGHPLIVLSKKIEKNFGGKFLTVVGFYPKQGTVFTPEILDKIKSVTEKVEDVPGVKQSSVMSLMSKKVQFIRSDENQIEITPLSDGVPQTADAMESFRKRVYDNPASNGLLVNKDGTAAVVIIDFNDFEKAGGSEGFYTKLEEIIQPERTENLEIVSTGTPALLFWLMVYTRRVAWLFGLTLVMVGYLHYRAFRTLQGMFIPLVTALMGVVWAMGMMGGLHLPMDPYNIMTPILLLAIGAGHSVQILKRYYEEFARLEREHPDQSPVERNREAVVEATVKVGAVMLAAGTIASLSFASLFTLGLPSIRNFGICAAFGIMAALTVEMTFIPAVRVLLPAPTKRQTDREKKREFFDPLLEGLANIIRQKRERPILYIALILVAVAIVGVFRVEANNTLGAQFFEFNGLMRGFRLADAKTAGTRVLQVLVEADDSAAPQAPAAAADAGSPSTVAVDENAPNFEPIKNPDILRRIDELEHYIVNKNPEVGKAVSIADVLKTFNRVLNENNPAFEVVPATRRAVAQFLLLYEMSGDTSDLERLVDIVHYERAVIVLYLKNDEHRTIERIINDVTNEIKTRFPPGCGVKAAIGGGIANGIALNETMVKGKINNLIQISIIIMLITTILLRSFTGGLLVLLPLACSALINLGLMGWTGVWLTMATAAISAMAVGIGADYAIYFIFRVREEFNRRHDMREAVAIALTTSGKAIAYVATAVAGGYLCLVLSGFKIHVQLGVLVALTMVVCCTATVAFLPAVLLRVKPRFLTRPIAEKNQGDAEVEPACESESENGSLAQSSRSS